MADRFFYNQSHGNLPTEVRIYATITAAADVQVSGYTVTKGSKYISACARTAEGKAKLSFTDRYKECKMVHMISTRPSSVVNIENDSIDTTDPHIDLEFQNAAADTDPDSAVMKFCFTFLNGGEDLA